jgi:ribosomal protein L34E
MTRILYHCTRCGAVTRWVVRDEAPEVCRVGCQASARDPNRPYAILRCGGRLERVAELRAVDSDVAGD